MVEKHLRPTQHVETATPHPAEHLHLIKDSFDTIAEARDHPIGWLRILHARHEKALEILGSADENLDAAREKTNDAEADQHMFSLQSSLDGFSHHHHEQRLLIEEAMRDHPNADARRLPLRFDE